MIQDAQTGENPSFEQEMPNHFSVVGIVTSPAHQAALHTFFDQIRKDSNLIYLIFRQYEQQDDTFALNDLAAHSPIPVYRAQYHQELRPNCVYILPPHWEGSVNAQRLTAKEPARSDDNGKMVDRFLFSLADSLGSYAIAVLLVEDGLHGLRGIDAISLVHGLMVMKESPEARQMISGDSESAAEHLIRILPVKEMPDQIADYIRFYSHDVKEMVSDERAVLFSILKQGTGVDFSQYKQASIFRRIHHRMQTKRISTLGEFISLLRSDSEEVSTLYNELLIGATHFFRDSNAFEVLAETVLPAIIERRRAEKQIRIWVAGCSTGEEVYSIAILLHTMMSELDGFDCKIFATDLDPEAIVIASRGRYAKEAAQHLSAKQLRTYFTRIGHDYQVNKEIRDSVIFARHNILNDPPFSQMDLITCRNVLIYLNPEMQRHVLSLFHFALKPDGYIFLGPSESLGTLAESFQPVDMRSNIFQYKRARQGLPLHAFRAASQIREEKNVRQHKILSRIRETDRLIQLDGIFTKLLEQYVSPFIIVDEEDDILHINGDARQYLVVPKGKPSHNLYHMIPDHWVYPMRTVLHKVRRDHHEIIYRNISRWDIEQQEVVNLVIRPFEMPGALGQLTILLFETNDERPSCTPVNQEVYYEENEHASQHITDLQHELASVKATLQLTAEELDAAHEEFQKTNEELIVANEELQSANEELQSINEEFIAVNSEYQHKIQELTDLNDDMNNLFVSTDMATLFLDSRMDIRKFTPAVTAYFNLKEVDMGRSIRDISHILKYDTLTQDIQQVLLTHEGLEREVQDSIGRSFNVCLSPYRSIRESNQGVVITLLDITELKKSSEQLLIFSYAIEQSPSCIMIVDTARQIRYVNMKYEQLTGFRADDVKGKILRLYSDHLSDEAMEEVWATVSQGQQWQGELLNRKKTGEEFHETVTLLPIKSREGTITYFLKIAEDLTERNETLEALQHSEIMSVIGQLAAGIAHEIRNPITVLKGFTQMLEPKIEQKHYIQIMLSEFNRIESIITELLQLASPHQSHFQMCNVLALLRDVVMFMEPQALLKNVHIVIPEMAPVPLVRGVPNQLKQVFMNVVKNGVEAMPYGGELSIKVIWVDLQTMMIQFTDQGMGIPAHILPKIGVPFYTTKEDGTGLGLMVSYKIIENHHGSLAIKSTLGKGTTVEITLHAEPDQPVRST